MCMNIIINRCSQYYVCMLLLQHKVTCVWPPSYTADFQHQDNFVISADVSLSEDEEEMLKEADIVSLQLDIDNSKLEHLHRQFKKREISTSTDANNKFPMPEESYDTEDLSLQIRKRMVSSNNLQTDYNIQNYTTKDKMLEEHFLNKRNQEETEQYDENKLEVILNSSTTKPLKQYDYNSFKADYYSEVEEERHSNKTYNYTKRGRHGESMGEAVEKIIDIKKPKNCSKEENKNFGIKSIECIWDDFKKSHTKMDKIKLFKNLMKILMIWLLIYVVIAVPCWCKYGLCCCCCCCSFCRPRRLMNKAKKYIATNPPGVLFEDGTEKQHEPTIYEIEAYNKLLKSIRKL